MSKRRSNRKARVVIPNTGIVTKVAVDYKRIFGFTLTDQEIKGLFRNASMGEQLFAIARLNALFEAGIDSRIILEQTIARLQDSQASLKFLDPLKILVDKGRVPNAPNVLLNVAKKILIEGNPSTWMHTRPFDDPNVICLSMYLAAVISGTIEPKLNHETILLETVQNGVFYKKSDLGIVLQRSHECFWQLASQPERFRSSEFVDIPATFLRIMGIEIRSFIFFLTAMVITYAPSLVNAEEFLWSNRLAKNLNILVGRFGIQVLQRILDEMSVSVDEFRQSHSNAVNHRWDFSYFRQKPLIHVDQVFYPLYSRFVLDYIWDGLYWRIVDGLEEGERNKFRVFFGRIFEMYCQDLLSSVQEKINGRLVPEFEYKKGVLTPDAFVQCGSDLVVIDFKAKRLKMNDTLINGDRDSFVEDMKQLFFTPAQKIHRHLKEMAKLTGEKTIDITAARRIHAIVVTQGAFASIKQMYQEIDDYLRQEGLYEELPIIQWHLLDIDEFEMLIGLLDHGARLMGILNQKSVPRYRYLSFSDYIAYSRPKAQYASVLVDRGQSVTNEVLAILSGNQEEA